jgi:hypothetical protein
MSLNLTTASLRELLSLTEKRETLACELAAINAKIEAALSGTTALPSARKSLGGDQVGNRRPVKASRKRGKRGATKEAILAALKTAGSAGIAVRNLAASLGLKNQNVHVLFHTTGKKIREIEKAGKATYRFKGTEGAKPDPSPAPDPLGKSKVSQGSRRKRPGKGARLSRK